MLNLLIFCPRDSLEPWPSTINPEGFALFFFKPALGFLGQRIGPSQDGTEQE